MKPEMKKLIIANLPYLLFVYLFGKLGQTYRLAAGADLSEKLLHLADGFSLAFESAAPSFHLFDLAVGVAGAVALRLMVYCKSKNAKKYRRGVEYGSARWGGPKDIAPYIDPVFDNNILLTQTERLTMNNRPKDPKTARNKNVLVIGGSGSGKTRFFVKPNLMQCVSKDYPTSFVITDPKGSLIGEVGQLLVRCGYRVKVLNTINFSKSMRYNPFRYIHSEKDILKLVNTLICNTKGEGEKSAEDFWIKSERLLYSALIGYIWYEAPDDEMNFTTLLEMINASEAREDDPEFQSPVPSRRARRKKYWNGRTNCTTATRQRKRPRTPGKPWRRPPAPFPGCSLPPRNGPPRSWPRISKRQKNGRISWKRPKKPCQKSASLPRKPFMTKPRARPKAGCILTRWRKPLPSSNQTRPAAPYRKPGFTSTEKSMR